MLSMTPISHVQPLNVLFYLVAHSRALICSVHLCKLLVLLLPPARISDAKAVLKDLANVLKGHSLDFREAEDDEEPTDKADTSVETEGAGRSNSLHHSEEGGCDDDIG